MKVGIVNYIGNIGSVKAALDRLGVEHGEINGPDDFEQYSHIILPGVGAFDEGMQRLMDLNIVDSICSTRKPLLGICLGMQLLADYGEEGGGCDGLGLISGSILKIPKQPLPIIGWNDVVTSDNTLTGPFYFVHSYFFNTDKYDVGVSNYNGFVYPVIVKKDNFLGVQFHPEKSSKAGMKFLREWLNHV